MYRIIQVSEVDDPKTAQMEAVLLDAFDEDAFTHTCVGGHRELLKIQWRAFMRAGIVGGKFYVAVNEDDEVVGTAVWYPPGSDFLSDEKQKQQGITELFEAIQQLDPPLYSWWMNEFFPSFVALGDKFLGEGFKMKHWSLYSLAVAPKYQGRGICKLLMQVGEDQAASEGLCTVLEAASEKNLAIYKHLGYTDTGFSYIAGPPNIPGVTPHWLFKTPRQGGTVGERL